MRKIGDKGSSAVLAVFLRNDLLKNVFLGRSSFCPSSHPTCLVGGWAVQSRNHKAASRGDLQPKNQITLLFHSHPTSSHSPCSPPSLPPPRPPPTPHPRHKCMLILPSHFMLSAALMHLMPGNVWISCWLGTVTWGFF